MTWIQALINYCQEYNIPIEYLGNTLYDPKVVPMIRGKAFEFSVATVLTEILDKAEWEVDKPLTNAQLGVHDADVRIKHISTNKIITVECKLAKNKSYGVIKKHTFPEKMVSKIAVKCMRSRTLGSEMVEKLAPIVGVDKELLAIHNDQYLPKNFDLVVTSIGNAFYRTNKETSRFEWKPTDNEIKFLESINDTIMNLKDFAFSRMYIAKSWDLIVSPQTGITCTRKKCKSTDCGFIPNYPLICFEHGNKVPIARWVPIENSEPLFRQFIS